MGTNAPARPAPTRLEATLVVTGLLASVAMTATWRDAAALIVAVGLVAAASRLAWRSVLVRLRPYLLFGLIAVVFGGIDYGVGESGARTVGVNPAGMANAGIAAMRLVGIGAAAVWINLCVGATRFMAAMAGIGRRVARIGVDPTPLLMGAAIALRLLPLLQIEAARVRMAWEARGAGLLGRGPTGRFINAYGLALPLMAAALRRAEALATAIDMRTPSGRDQSLGAGFWPSLDSSSPRNERSGRFRFVLAAGAAWLPVIVGAWR